MLGSGSLVDHSALLQDMLSHATVSLLRGQEIDAAVMMFVVVPGDKLLAPLPGRFQVFKAFRLVIAVVF